MSKALVPSSGFEHITNGTNKRNNISWRVNITRKLHNKIICKTIVACMVLIISGCATSYSLIQQDSGEKSYGELIVGDEDLILDAIYRGIRQEFPTDNIMNLGRYEKGFAWDHVWGIDRTTLRLFIKKGTGVDSDGKPITGYYYTVNTYGTRGLAHGLYVVPLNDAIRATVLSSELVIVRAASVKEISVVQETRNAKARAQNCFEALSADGDLTLIKDKVSLVGAGEQTFSMLVDNSKPTTEEQKALLIWGNKRDVCFKEVRKALDAQGTAPAIKNVLTSGSHTAQMLLIDLYNGKLTYAEFANRRQDLTQVINEAIANIQSELQKQSAEAKARADQLALQAQQNMISAYQATNQVRQTQQMINQQQQQGQQTQQMINQQQQIINQQRMPINQSRTPITCQSIGNTMTCY